jgi:hypothetical protein
MPGQHKTKIIQLKYILAPDKTIKLTQVKLGGYDRIDVPTLTMDNETTWFIEGENEQAGDVIMLTMVQDPDARTQARTILEAEIEGMFASRKRVEAAANKSGHKLTNWEPIDKQTGGRSWIGATCMLCSRVVELEPIAATLERVAHYRPRTSFYLRKCQPLP